MNRFVTIAIAVVIAIASPARADDLLFRNEPYLFRFLYPDTWAQVPARGKHVRASVTSNGGHGLANCNVVVRPVPQFEHLSRGEIEAEISGSFTREFMEETIGAAPGMEVVDASEDKLDNRPAGFALAKTTYQTAGIRIEATLLFAVTFTRLGMYVITCGSPSDQFERDRPELVKIIRSFVFEDYGN